MNFLDSYDITRSNTPNPDQLAGQPSLNEEVNQVMGQLGRFWGGFRKQSQQVLEVARKDFGDVVVQAQKELSKLATTPETNQDQPADHKEGDDQGTSTEATNKEAGPSGGSPTDPAETISTPRASTSSDTWTGTTQAFLSRLQSTLPPNIVATVQNNVPESIKHATENIDFTQLRTNLLNDLQRVQGVTKAQAEEYYHKSEALLKDAMKEANNVLRDAVKVVPPEENAASGATANLGAGMLWDGTDMWMLSLDNTAAESSSGSSKVVGKGKAVHAAAVATRAEALLKRLKSDPSILRHNPEAEDVSKDVFSSWREKAVEQKEGGIENAEWSAKIKATLEDGPDGQALKRLEETLVPAEMTKEVFWQRFFFRTHQIRAEEEKRKALIESTSQADEDFSWEDEEEEEEDSDEEEEEEDEDDSSSTSTSTSPDTKAPVAAEVPAKAIGPLSPTIAQLRADVPSRRVSSEDSFDLVSSASTNASVAGDVEKAPKPKQQDDNDDDEEEESGESDWE